MRFVFGISTLATLLLSIGVTTGCASAEDGDEGEELSGETEESSDALQDSGPFNPHGMAHRDLCVKLAGQAASLFFPDGKATNFRVAHGDTILGHNRARCAEQADSIGDRAGADAIRAGRPSGYIVVDAHELARSNKLVFHRGGYGYANPAIKYGYVKLGELVQRDQNRILKGMTGDIRRDGTTARFGKPCSPTAKTYRVLVRPIPAVMQFRKSRGATDTNSWESYGDPSSQFVAASVKYTYLNWTWPAQPGGAGTEGGGHVRTLVKDGATFRRCDIKAVTSPTYVENTTNPNGSIVGVYGELNVDGQKFYGWVPYSHTYGGRTVMHIQ